MLHSHFFSHLLFLFLVQKLVRLTLTFSPFLIYPSLLVALASSGHPPLIQLKVLVASLLEMLVASLLGHPPLVQLEMLDGAGRALPQEMQLVQLALN